MSEKSKLMFAAANVTSLVAEANAAVIRLIDDIEGGQSRRGDVLSNGLG